MHGCVFVLPLQIKELIADYIFAIAQTFRRFLSPCFVILGGSLALSHNFCYQISIFEVHVFVNDRQLSFEKMINCLIPQTSRWLRCLCGCSDEDETRPRTRSARASRASRRRDDADEDTPPPAPPHYDDDEEPRKRKGKKKRKSGKWPLKISWVCHKTSFSLSYF